MGSGGLIQEPSPSESAEADKSAAVPGELEFCDCGGVRESSQVITRRRQ